MIFGNNQDSIDKIEQQLFVNFNLLPSFSRRYVHICNKSLRIWTVSLNTESKNTPVVLIHGFGGGSAFNRGSRDSAALGDPNDSGKVGDAVHGAVCE